MVYSRTRKTSFSKLLRHRLDLTTENLCIHLEGHYLLIGRNMCWKFSIPLNKYNLYVAGELEWGNFCLFSLQNKILKGILWLASHSKKVRVRRSVCSPHTQPIPKQTAKIAYFNLVIAYNDLISNTLRFLKLWGDRHSLGHLDSATASSLLLFKPTRPHACRL